MSYININKLLTDWWRVITILLWLAFYESCKSMTNIRSTFQSFNIYVLYSIWNVEIPQTVEWGAIKNWSTLRTFEHIRCFIYCPTIWRDCGNLFYYYYNLAVFYWKWSWNTYIGKHLFFFFLNNFISNIAKSAK